MGIKIICPNGHKLNVKSFLAGKRGVCPQCGTKFDIPSDAEEEAPAVDSLAGVTSLPAAAGGVASAPQPANVVVAAADPGVHLPGSPATPAQPLADPLAEAPEACWYVRPPSGGQYGPAKTHIMRQWIHEGRVTPDSLVWREGWPDWKLAGEAFPNLPGANSPSAADGVAPVVSAVRPGVAAPLGSVQSAVVQPTAVAPVQPAAPKGGLLLNIAPDESTAHRGKRPRRRDKTSGRLTALVFLFIVLIVLAVILVVVLR